MSNKNQLQVNRATAAIAPLYVEAGDRQAALRDMLTDLKHYADAYGLDFNEAFLGSHEVYLEELGD